MIRWGGGALFKGINCHLNTIICTQHSDIINLRWCVSIWYACICFSYVLQTWVLFDIKHIKWVFGIRVVYTSLAMNTTQLCICVYPSFYLR